MVARAIAGLIGILTLFGCERAPEQRARVAVEFRIAETEPGEGLTEVSLPISGETFYLHDDVVLTNAEIASATVVRWHGHPAVEVTLNEEGTEQFAGVTESNISKRLAMLVDGKLVCAPVIRAPILVGKAIVVGDFSEKEARRIANGVLGR